MNSNFEEYFILIDLALFPIMWLVVTTILRKKAGMVKVLEVETGELVRDSGWGSGKINGVSAQNCVKVLEYDNGYIINLMFIFGGGKIWLPKSSVSIVKQRNRRFILPAYKELVSGKNRVKLFGKLSDLF